MKWIKDWTWMSPSNTLHAYHQTKNSVTACGIDWDGFNKILAIDLRSYKLCKRCKKVMPKPPKKD